MKVVDNRLWIKAESTMLGYLNAASAFDDEGYFDTGDVVEVDGEWLRILGRASEVINVGGSKVFPAEVESVLLTLDNVEDAVVYAEPNPLTGQTVAATIKLQHEESAPQFKLRMRRFCQGPAGAIPNSDTGAVHQRTAPQRTIQADAAGGGQSGVVRPSGNA